MKAFVNYTKSSLTSLSQRVENLGLFKSYYYKQNYKEKFKTSEDYTIKDLQLFDEVFASQVKEKNYNEALCFYYSSYALKYKKPFFNVFKWKKWEEQSQLHQKIGANMAITVDKTKKSVLKSKNALLLKGISIKRDRREYIVHQRWNIIFFLLVLFIYTNIPNICYKSASKHYIL